jgi:hypothetical protein
MRGLKPHGRCSRVEWCLGAIAVVESAVLPILVWGPPNVWAVTSGREYHEDMSTSESEDQQEKCVSKAAWFTAELYGMESGFIGHDGEEFPFRMPVLVFLVFTT